MTWTITNALKGIGGEFELNRLVGAFGGVAYVIGAHVFLGYEVWWLGKDFDLESYCLTFPTGLGIAVGAIAGAVALKDRQVANAKVIAETNSNPATPPNPAPEPKPETTPAAALPEYAA